MRSTDFNISEALSFGWSMLKDHVGLLIGLVVVSALASAVPYGLQAATAEKSQALGFLFGLLGMLVSTVIALGWVNIALMLYDGDNPELANLFDRWNLIVPYLLTSIAYSIVVSIGLFLLVIPGIIAGIKLQFYMYRVVDAGSGPIDALKESWAMTNGVSLKLFGWAIVIAVINFAGALALGLGLLVTVPVTALAQTYVYRKLSEGTNPSLLGATFRV